MIKWPEIQYRKAEDGMLYPDIDFPKQPAGDIGKYGSMRRTYLENHRPVTYQMMILEGTLKQHLLDINVQAHEMLDQLIESMKKSEGITEHLKSSNQLEWVQRMNSIKHRAEEIIITELIYPNAARNQLFFIFSVYHFINVESIVLLNRYRMIWFSLFIRLFILGISGLKNENIITLKKRRRKAMMLALRRLLIFGIQDKRKNNPNVSPISKRFELFWFGRETGLEFNVIQQPHHILCNTVS